MSDRRFMRMLEPIKRRVLMSIGRAVVRAVSDDLGRQLHQIELLKGELRDQVERMQDYGFTSVPHPGADAAVVFVAGNREHGIIVAVDDRRYRLTGLAAGEVALYDDLGQRVHLSRTGIVVDTTLDLSATVGGDLDAGVGGSVTVTAVGNVTITAPTVTIDGDLAVTGGIDCTGGLDVTGDADFAGEVRSDGTRIDKTHKHGGVVTGPNQTSVVV
jgi:phage baseplate assembly protein V